MEEAEKERLQKIRKGYDTNRNLAMGLGVFLIYVTFKDIKSNPGSPLWYAIMALIFCGAIAIAVRDTVLIKRIDKQLKDSEQAAVTGSSNRQQ